MPKRPHTVHLAQAHDRQRRDLSRDLHKNAAQQIAALQFQLGLLEQSSGELPPRAANTLRECMSLVEACALEIRRISYALHPPLLDELGLVATLRNHPDVQKIAADLPDSLPRLSPDVEIAIYRVIEEALPHISMFSLAQVRDLVVLKLDLASPSSTIRERVRGFRGRIARNSALLRITVPVNAKAAKS